VKVATEKIFLPQNPRGSLSNTMKYDDASRTLRWDRQKGGITVELLHLLREHAGTLRQLHVA
jgi:hypothetical protein